MPQMTERRDAGSPAPLRRPPMIPRPLSAEMHEASSDVWDGLHSHPFLRDMARGELPLEKFRYFLEQDVLYLPDFARCIAQGAAKSTSEEELRFFTLELDGTLNRELPHQREVLEHVCRLGAADHGGSLGMAPANVAYTSFMTSVAARGGPLEIMAAILPCPWSYREIAARLADDLADHPVYTEWVGFYLGDEMTKLLDELRGTVDAMAARAGDDPDRRARLIEIFKTSSRLEGAFWQMAYTFDQWPDLRQHSASHPGDQLLDPR